jgi:hypothetical protein
MKKLIPFFLLILIGFSMLFYNSNVDFLVNCSYYFFAISALLGGYYINGFIKNKEKTFLISLILSFITYIVYYKLNYFIVIFLFYLFLFINLVCAISIILKKIIENESMLIYYIISIILFILSLFIISFTKTNFIYFIFTLINSLSIFYFLGLVIVNVLYKSKI